VAASEREVVRGLGVRRWETSKPESEGMSGGHGRFGFAPVGQGAPTPCDSDSKKIRTSEGSKN